MKKKLIASIIFILVCIASTMIYAAIDAKVEINPSASTVVPGTEVMFTIKLKDIVSGNGANGLEGTIAYDTDKFEAITEANVEKAGPWDVAYFNGKIIAEGLTAVSENSNIVSIKLKVKGDNALIGKTAGISLNNIVVYNTEKVDLGTVSASVKIGEDSSNQDTENTPTPTTKPTATPDGGSESTPTPSTKPEGTKPTPTPTATSKPNSGENKNDVPITNIDTNTSSGSSSSSSSTSSSSSNKGTNGSTTSSTSLPKAGIGSTIAILTVIVAIIGTVSYIKLRKYNEI